VQKTGTPQNKAFSKLVIISCLAVCAFAFYRVFATKTGGPPSSDTDKQKAQTALYIPPESLAFGNVWEQPDFVLSVPISNKSKRPIDVHFSSACSCAAIKPSNLKLQAGETSIIGLSLNLFNRDQSPESGGIFQSSIIADYDQDGSPSQAKWAVQGSLSALWALPRFSIDFGQRSVLEQSLPPFRVKLSSHQPLRDIWVRSTNPNVKVEILEEPSPSDEIFLIVTPMNLHAGPITGSIILDYVSPFSNRDRPLSLPFAGMIVDDVQPPNSRILFGVHAVGSITMEQVSLKSLSGTPFDVVGIGSMSKGISATPTGPASADGSHVYSIHQRIVSTGDHATTLTFHIRSKKGESTYVTIPGWYFGE
jgi:hypothetical protein